jgi:hypothetical protein
LTNTLLIDDDGIYDPRQLNDRLVLGMKGSIAEYELALMRQRAVCLRGKNPARVCHVGSPSGVRADARQSH